MSKQLNMFSEMERDDNINVLATGLETLQATMLALSMSATTLNDKGFHELASEVNEVAVDCNIIHSQVRSKFMEIMFNDIKR